MECDTQLKKLSLFPSFFWTGLFLFLLMRAYEDGLFEMIVAGYSGITLGLLSTILIIIYKIDMSNYFVYYLKVGICSAIVVVISWFFFLSSVFKQEVIINLPLITYGISVYVFAVKTKKIKDTIVFVLINPNIYYLIFANLFALGFARELGGEWWIQWL